MEVNTHVCFFNGINIDETVYVAYYVSAGIFLDLQKEKVVE